MAVWGPYSQNGNTTIGWTVWGGNITNHEAFAVQLETSGTSNTGALLSNVIVYCNPTKYSLNITAEGPGAISYHINSNQV